MSAPCRAALFSLGILIGLWLASVESLAQERAGKFRESVSIEVNSQVVKSLATAKDLLNLKQYEQALPVLQQLIEQQGESLVPIEPGRYWNVSDYCHSLISRLPPEALKVYRDRVDPIVRNSFEVGRRDFDERELRRVIQLGFNSSFGDDALWLLGHLAFERGRFALALNYWEQMVPSRAEAGDALGDPVLDLTYPHPEYPAADVTALLVLCRIFEGDLHRADEELKAFKTLYPDVKGRLLNEDGELAPLLAKWRAEAAQWPPVATSSQDPVTFGGHASRNYLANEDVEPLGLNWVVPLPENRFRPFADKPAGGLVFRGAQDRPALAYFPVVSNGTVYFGGSDSLHAVDLPSGQPRWAGAANDSSLIHSNVAEKPITPNLDTVGVAQYSVTVDQGRLFARLGPPILRRSRNEGHTFSEIVGLDLNAEGRVMFHRSSSVLDGEDVSPEATFWSFEGTPVVSGNRVYASARRAVPEEEIEVVCFDASSGQLLWRRRLFSVVKEIRDEFSTLGHRLMTLSDGRLFIGSGEGAISALDAASGRLLWIATYESAARADSPVELNDSQRFGLRPCLVSGSLVFAAPSDSAFVMAFDASTGRLAWKQRLPDRIQHLLGVAGHTLVLSGRYLWALDTDRGLPVWPEKRLGYDDPNSFGFGRGVLSKSSVYWPLHNEIWRVDIATGTVRNKYELHESLAQSGGNLLIADGQLLIAQPDQLVALGNAANPPSRRKKITQSLPTDRMLDEPIRFTPLPEGVSERSSSSHLWPVERAWQRPLSVATSVLTTNSGHVVLQSGTSLEVIELASQRSLWTASSIRPVRTVTANAVALISVDDFGVQARNWQDGGALWRVSFPSESGLIREFKVLHPHAAICRSERSLFGLNLQTGAIAWQFPSSTASQAGPRSRTKPSLLQQEKLPQLWSLNDQSALFREAGTNRTQLFNLRSGNAQDLSVPPAIRRAHQVQTELGDTYIATLSTEHRLECWTPSRGLLWRHAPQISVAHQAPELLVARGVLVLLEEGLFARGLEIETGRVLWTHPLRRLPVKDWDPVLHWHDNRLIASGTSNVARIDARTGQVAWRLPLDPGEWVVDAADDSVVVLRSDRSDATELLVANTMSGEKLQSLRMPLSRAKHPLQVSRSNAVYASERELICLHPIGIGGLTDDSK